MTITLQPVDQQLFAAYQPILFQVSEVDCPIMFCDIYIDDVYYKSTSKTHGFQFDISDIMQEWHKKTLPPLGVTLIYPSNNAFNKVQCKFRSTFINSDGFQESIYTEPIQGTLTDPPVSGTGVSSVEFYSVNSALQQDDNQDLITHLDEYKYGTWALEYHPLTHRPATCSIKLDQSDFWPFVTLLNFTDICLQLNYKLKNVPGEFSETNCDVLNPSIEFQWSREIDAIMTVDIAGCINGTFSLIDWGDGTVNSSTSHTYTLAKIYTVKIYGSNTTKFDMFNSIADPSYWALISIIYLPASITHINVSNNYLTNINVVQFCPNLEYLSITKNNSNTLNLNNNTALLQLHAAYNSIGTVSLTTNTLLEYIELSYNQLTGGTFTSFANLHTLLVDHNQLPGLPNLTTMPNVVNLFAEDNLMSVTAVNNILTQLDTNNKPIGSVRTNAQSPTAPPSGGGITAKNNLITKGWSVLTD